MTLTAADLVTDARRQIREIGPHQFAAQPQRCVLIDAREPAEFVTGHRADAINIPRGVLECQVDAHPGAANVIAPALSHKDRPIVVACRTGGRAALAALNLQRMGFNDVRSIAGGITDGTAAGLPMRMR